MSHKRRFQLLAFEQTGYLLQTFQVPFLEKKKDKAIRRVYTVANLVRAKEGLPKKTYRMLNCKGRMEEIH
jgi:hypothetical protein